jgi:membrane protease YdiL (CAAX protease family)
VKGALVLARSLATGFVVAAVGIYPWPVLAKFNLRIAPRVPWAVVAMCGALTLYCWYFSGHGWPRSTAKARSESSRTWKLRPPVLKWSVIAGTLGAIGMQAIWWACMRLSGLKQSAFDPPVPIHNFPWWFIYSALLMSCLVAGIAEEMGYRGYMQYPLEQRFGPSIAIAVVTIVFWLIHMIHQWAAPSMAVPLVYAGIYLGALAYCSRSLLPESPRARSSTCMTICMSGNSSGNTI